MRTDLQKKNKQTNEEVREMKDEIDKHKITKKKF